MKEKIKGNVKVFSDSLKEAEAKGRKEAYRKLVILKFQEYLTEMDRQKFHDGVYYMAHWLVKNCGWKFRSTRMEGALQDIEIGKTAGFEADIAKVDEKILSLYEFYGVRLIEPTNILEVYSEDKDKPETKYCIMNGEGQYYRSHFDLKKAKKYPWGYIQRINNKTIVFETDIPSADRFETEKMTTVSELTRNHQVQRYINLRNAYHRFFSGLESQIKYEWLWGKGKARSVK